MLSYKLFIAVVKAKNSTKQEIFVIFYGMKSLKMNHNIKSIRTFIGAKNYNLSRQFYLDFGFEEIKICVGYSVDGKQINYLPSAALEQQKIKPVYEVMKGWEGSIVGIKKMIKQFFIFLIMLPK